MTSTEITPTMVQSEEIKTTLVSGSTPRKLMKLYLEGTKIYATDYFLLSNYLSAADAANVLSHHGVTKITGDSTAIDVITYDYDDYKLDLTDAAVGTTFVKVIYYTEG